MLRKPSPVFAVPHLLTRGSFETMARFVSPEGFPADEFAALQNRKLWPHTWGPRWNQATYKLVLLSLDPSRWWSLRGIANKKKKKKKKEKNKKKKKGKETINACVSEDRYKLARWRVGADRLSNILRDARFISRRPKEFDAFRNNFMSGLLRVRAGQVIEIFRFRKLWPWRGKIEIVNQFVGKL